MKPGVISVQVYARYAGALVTAKREKLDMLANAQRDGRLPNIGGALCSTPQSLADVHY